MGLNQQKKHLADADKGLLLKGVFTPLVHWDEIYFLFHDKCTQTYK